MSYKTEQRTRLYELLKANPHKFFSAKDIVEALAPYNISISAVYRNLAVLTEDGVVKKSIRKNGRESIYRYADNDTCRDEIHLTCTNCGKVFHMDHELTKTIQDALDKEDGFQIDKLKTVIFGLCEECRAKQQDSE